MQAPIKFFKNNKYALGLFILFVIIAFIEFKLKNVLEQDDSRDLTITNHFLNDFSMIETNENGERDWELDGKRLEKYPQSERSEVFSPSMRIFNEDNSYWEITAKHALDPDSIFASIYLTGDVVFHKIGVNESKEIMINTASAIIYPGKELIETDDFAKIITPTSVTTGVGVVANIKQGYVEILSNAERISSENDKTEQISGDRMIYNLTSKTWMVSKRKNTDKKEITERVKTILRTKKNN
tara:strand:- start:2743 stop:3465 length:723 start_codon:yes stop_codon:yes gene_type:complete